MGIHPPQPLGNAPGPKEGGGSSSAYAQPPGMQAAPSRPVQRSLFNTPNTGNAGNQAKQGQSPSSSSRPTNGSRGGEKGKRPIDAEGFQVVSARKTFKPRQQSSGYASPNEFDLVQDIPSPDSLAAIEACTTAEKKKLQVNQDINLEINMTDSDDSSQGTESTQMVPSSQ